MLSSLKLKMASPYRTPVTESVMAAKFKVPDYCSKQKASSNNIMERRAQPNGTIMASKRMEIGLVSHCPCGYIFCAFALPSLGLFS